MHQIIVKIRFFLSEIWPDAGNVFENNSRIHVTTFIEDELVSFVSDVVDIIGVQF
ncbi:hypothetical protein D3C80_1894740 [compost metagenome]